jgi:xylulokinase
MYFLGLDLGTSSIKASVVDAQTQQVLAAAHYPDVEAAIDSPQTGWAEQSPEMWWQNTILAIKRVLTKIDVKKIEAIGISYQMHGLVMLDKNRKVLRPSIIWCDSRAVAVGEAAFKAIGEERSLAHLLNSPGNFTASKLAWVKANEPAIYAQCDKIMLPGDYISMRLTDELTTSASSLSEGIFWNFKENEVSADIMRVYGFEASFLPKIQDVFSNHGQVSKQIAEEFGFNRNVSVCYKAGDQPNNALSLSVLDAGEIAATAGTSGVIYAVSDKVAYDAASRVNTFAHVNHEPAKAKTSLGILLCINGTGILNAWTKRSYGNNLTYAEMNKQAAGVKIGSEGLLMMPFGNGAERMLQNKVLGASMHGINLNLHQSSHVFRAAQEGIAFSMQYGFEVMKNMGVQPSVIRAGKANMFLSEVFQEAVVNTTGVPVELYDTDGAKGAALGAGIGLGYFSKPKDAFTKLTKIGVIEPEKHKTAAYQETYQKWQAMLMKLLVNQ